MLLIGCGYVGQPLASALAATHEIYVASRSAQTPSANSNVIACDITEPTSVAALPREFDIVINTVSSGKGGVEQYRSVYFEGTRRLLEHLRSQKYIWTSSTSVYAQTDGSTVTEQSAADPDALTSRILRDTEELVLSKPHGIILRLAGIYGPGRGHLFQQYLRGEARIHGEGARWLNMVHRDDVVGAIIAALERAPGGQIYNVADNEPVTEGAFFAWLAHRLKRELPPRTDKEATGRKRGVTNKRVSNRKLREELDYEFIYPTFREGYESEIQRTVTVRPPAR